ncbi:30S ribosomal protein S12 methylthiotransferase RimO [Helicobacter pylori]|nr:30S ribosomal protein S12 methylthiotransferase RimO [Helicobacter pylori]
MQIKENKQLCLISLGCSKNLVDSEVMLGKLYNYTLTDDAKKADVILINTCGFIESAKQESIQTILNAAKDKKEGAILIASGCLSERYKDEIKELIPEVDIFTGVGDYDKIDILIAKKQNQFSEQVFLSEHYNARIITGSSVHAYVKISEGCNQKCSFCAIPSFKGKLQSRELDSILKEVEDLALKGYKDMTFIAQDSSSFLYDKGQKDGLIQLIKAIDKQQALKSARILYLYPSSTTLELIGAIESSPIFQNYFDMPIQHISDSMLKKMRRNSSQAHHLKLLDAMKQVKESFIRSTIIVGHPEENEGEFEELSAFLDEFQFDRLNIFAFSAEENTHAYSLEKVPKKIINARIKALNKIALKHQNHSFKALLNKPIKALVENKEGEYFYKARDLRWAPEVDGEILINDSALTTPLKPGHYTIVPSAFKDNILLAKVLSPF